MVYGASGPAESHEVIDVGPKGTGNRVVTLTLAPPGSDGVWGGGQGDSSLSRYCVSAHSLDATSTLEPMTHHYK